MKEVTEKVRGDLVGTASGAGAKQVLSSRLRLIVQPGEILILTEPTSEAEATSCKS